MKASTKYFLTATAALTLSFASCNNSVESYIYSKIEDRITQVAETKTRVNYSRNVRNAYGFFKEGETLATKPDTTLRIFGSLENYLKKEDHFRAVEDSLQERLQYFSRTPIYIDYYLQDMAFDGEGAFLEKCLFLGGCALFFSATSLITIGIKHKADDN